jgi:hypothetical protein
VLHGGLRIGMRRWACDPWTQGWGAVAAAGRRGRRRHSSRSAGKVARTRSWLAVPRGDELVIRERWSATGFWSCVHEGAPSCSPWDASSPGWEGAIEIRPVSQAGLDDPTRWLAVEREEGAFVRGAAEIRLLSRAGRRAGADGRARGAEA